MSIDSIGDFLTSIRNGIMVSKRSVSVPFSKMKFRIAQILKDEGFVREIKKVEDERGKNRLVIHLKYVDGDPVIHTVTRISKPGCRVYKGINEVAPVIGGMGISILSTSAGIITDKAAKKLSVGGEVICQIW